MEGKTLSSPDRKVRARRERAGRQKFPDQHGFSLIETCIALTILMIVALGVSSLFIYAISNNTGANDRELSMAVAQQRIEWLRSMPFNNTTATTAYAFPNGGLQATAGAVVETTTSGGRSYPVSTTITDLKTDTSAAAAAEPSTIKTITVSVQPLGAGPAWNQINGAWNATTTIFASVTMTTQRVMIHTGLNS
jgi:Tfp pilus assembly protein PilV